MRYVATNHQTVGSTTRGANATEMPPCMHTSGLAGDTWRRRVAAQAILCGRAGRGRFRLLFQIAIGDREKDSAKSADRTVD